MPSCLAPLCQSGRGKEKGEAKIHLFTFPDDKFIRCRWIRQLRKDPKRWQPGKSARLCSLHFEPQCFVSADLNRDKRGRPLKTPALKKDAVPTTFSFKTIKSERKPPKQRSLSSGKSTGFFCSL